MSIESEFRAAMIKHGIETTSELVADGILHRVHIIGHAAGKKNGAYTLHSDGKPSGYFQDFVTGLKITWTSDGVGSPIPTHNETRERAAARAALIEIEYQKSAAKAQSIWDSAAACINHPYLEKKKVKPFNTRMYIKNGKPILIIPIQNSMGEIQTLQFINAGGKKLMLKGGRAREGYSIVKSIENPARIAICEGFSTTASVAMAKPDYHAIAAISSGNLKSVGLVIRQQYPDAEITFFADNDENGVGQNSAVAASVAVGGTVVIPEDVGTDFNDYYNGATICRIK